MSRAGKLAPEVNRALFVKNLSYNVTPEDLFELFGKFGPIRQVRQGIATNTKGTAFVVYEDVMDAKQACDKLNGFNFQNRYLVVLYHQPEKMVKSKEDLEARKENLAQLKKQHDGSVDKLQTPRSHRTSAVPSLSPTSTYTSSSVPSLKKTRTPRTPPSPVKKPAKSTMATATPVIRKNRADDSAEQARSTLMGFVRGFLPRNSNKMCMT
ncbi:hypothetical protein PG997_004559 [Apiospora hydei]|uniref:RRM domain-containing protein n=1 Tax=Apiospora hydei TaxID=1337664 RepID=A0ABR1X2G2_9PEZI